MATNTDPIFLKTIATPAIQFTSADTTALKTVLTAGADGGAITQLTATSSDSAIVTAVLSLTSGGVTNIIGEVIVAIGAGTDGSTPAVNLLDLDQITLLQTDGSILLGPSAILSVNCRIAMTTGTLGVTAIGGSYSA